MQDILLCYKVLGLEPGATADRVRNAYLQLSRFYDPARYAGEPDHLSRAEQKRKEIEEAYQAIRNFLPELRGPLEKRPEVGKQDRDFNEMVQKPVHEFSRTVIGVVVAMALVFIFLFSFYIYRQSRGIQAQPSASVSVE